MEKMLNGLDLFSGIGGITIGLQEWIKPIAYCEIAPYCQSVLLQRMQEGDLPKAPIWDDIRTLSTKELPQIDIIYGGFPCQDISIAGKQKGLGGKRSGLFFEVLRLVDEETPSFIFLENVPNIRIKGAERVCKELAERGYDCRWCMLSASDVGARHKRERWFLLANSDNKRNGTSRNEDKEQSKTSQKREYTQYKSSRYSRFKQTDWTVEPDICRVVNGLPNRMDRIKALGNSVVPFQVKKAFQIFIGEIE